MLFLRTGCDALNRLEEIIRSNSDTLDSATIEELESIHMELARVDETDVDSDDYYTLWSVTEESLGEMELMQVEIEDTIEDWEKDADSLVDVIYEIMKKFTMYNYSVDTLLEKESGEGEADVIKKMINAGYKFNNGMGHQLQLAKKQEDKKIEKERLAKEREDKIKQQWEKIKSDFPLDIWSIKQIKEGVYRLSNYDIDASYDTNTHKLTGKGSRKQKDEIVECVKRYIEFVNEYGEIA